MFARASSRLGSRAFSSARAHAAPKSSHAQWLAASSTIAGVSLYVISKKPVYNDAPSTGNASSSKQQPEDVGLSPLVWGSNLNHLIAPEQDANDCIKSPTYAPELFSCPLRDLAFSSSHAACVDASGNVYQWGDSFFGSEHVESKQPRLTLQGKNIVSLAITPSKIFALSSSGRIYVLSSSLSRQLATQSPRSIWSLFGSSAPQTSFAILDTDIPLGWGERFTSISAGSDHLLALTSRSRTFAHPVTRSANWHGQLGLRKIFIHDPVDPSKTLPLELLPKSARDSLLRSERKSPFESYRSEAQPSDPVDDRTAGFCGYLFEVPALRGVNVQQVVAGDRTSFVVTHGNGRVLGWGANEFGQLGLGANVTLPSVSVPTEVVLSKFTERGTLSRCLGIAAGGDLTFFTVERDITTGASTVDVLACGNGQWGGLGNAAYSNAQGVPVKVKSISGILEYDEKTNSLSPLKPYHISVAPGPVSTSAGMRPSTSGHVIATLDTIPLSHPSPNSIAAIDTAGSPGRDILTWGLNQHYQLGNGKRASINAPAPVETADREGRLMCKVSKKKVKDFSGNVVGRRINIEQRAVAGPGISVIYWRTV